MKKLILAIFAVLPLVASAQSDWVRPSEIKSQNQTTTVDDGVKKKSKKVLDKKYLKGGAPLVDGKVQWTLELDVPGKSAQQIYDDLYQYLEDLTHQENQLKGSQIALVNPKEHSIATNVREWIVFKKNAISLDRAATSYKLFANCADNHLQLILTRIVFDYSENMPGKNGIFSAEEWISDEEALNKNGTKIYPGSSRFRRKMIDRKDEIFNQVSNLWK